MFGLQFYSNLLLRVNIKYSDGWFNFWFVFQINIDQPFIEFNVDIVIFSSMSLCVLSSLLCDVTTSWHWSRSRFMFALTHGESCWHVSIPHWQLGKTREHSEYDSSIEKRCYNVMSSHWLIPYPEWFLKRDFMLFFLYKHSLMICSRSITFENIDIQS